VTNGEGSVQAMKVEASGLKRHFDHVVLCDEHVWKPDPLPFRVAMNLLCVSPEETAMIGNSFDSDIAGAKNAGIYSVWVNRKGEEPGREIRPDAMVYNLAQLHELLDG
jgi:putative hydrolase of the HAD superfamily